MRSVLPRVGLGFAARRLPIGLRVLSPGYEGAQAKNTTPRGPPTRGRLPGGGIPPGGVQDRYRLPANAAMTSLANQESCSLNFVITLPSSLRPQQSCGR